MSTFADLVQLARICLRQARISRTPEVAHAFRRMAEEYQEKAVNQSDGEAPYIGERQPDKLRAAARR
jgi:hypothetical protein